MAYHESSLPYEGNSKWIIRLGQTIRLGIWLNQVLQVYYLELGILLEVHFLLLHVSQLGWEDWRFCYICPYFFPLLFWESLFIFFLLQGVLLQMTADLAQAMDFVQKVDYDVCQALHNNAIHVSLIKRLIELPKSWYTAIPPFVNHFHMFLVLSY